MVPPAEFRQNRRVCADALARTLLLQLDVATAAFATVLLGHQNVFLGRVQRRQLVPLRHLHVAQCDAVGPALQQEHTQILRWLERRVESWKALAARVATEQHHA